MRTGEYASRLVMLTCFIINSFLAFGNVDEQIIAEKNATDWSVEMSNWIIKNTPASAQPWNYTVGLVMEGLLRVYKRTNDHRYLDYVDSWGRKHISANGVIDTGMVSLDNIMSGFPILHLYSETHDERYRIAATTIRNSLRTWPTTTDKGYWHALVLNNELWLDGLYMDMPFLVTYGKMFNEEKTTNDEAIRQFKVHIAHLKDMSTGLLVHAYDEDGSAPWAVPPLRRSPWAWGRAIGWVTLGLSEIFDVIPPDYKNPDLMPLLEEYKSLLKTLSQYQDVPSGLWYQVVDYTDDTRNWLETSCSMMFIFSIKRAIEKGYIEKSYQTISDRGYAGILTKISEDAYGNVLLRDICEGTGVSSDISYYFNRKKRTNDNHGLGLFLIMNEFLAYDNLPWLSLNTGFTDMIDTDQSVRLYPNPCTNFTDLEIEIPKNGFDVVLYNVTGLRLKTIRVTQEKTRIDVSSLPQGIYFLKITIENKTTVRKLLKK